MKVVLQNGQEATVVIDKSSQTAKVKVGNREYMVCYMRDNKVKVKNDTILNSVDLAHVREEMKQFIKKPVDSKKAKGRK